MTEHEFIELLNEIQINKHESRTLEVKAARGGCPKKLYDTFSSFSNQDDGGIIVFGVDESNDYEECGVYDAQQIQKEINNQCQQMNPIVRPLITVLKKDGKAFVAAEIPAIDIVDRPCYYEGVGRIKGSYVRIGDSDEHMTEYEIYSFESYRQKYQDDIRVVGRATERYIDGNRLNEYLATIRKGKPNLAALNDDEIKKLMGLETDTGLTLSDVMVFGIYPQAYFPQLSINAVVVPGTEMGEVSEQGERFTDNQKIDGNISDMLDSALAFVRRNIRISTIIDESTGKRIDKPQYPITAIREALLNALVHRDYSIHTEGMPIQLTIFDDRIEIRNPGGLYGRITVDQLGKVQPDTRNPVLVNLLEVMGITENRYSGIPTIKRVMEEHGLREPVFKEERGTFVTILYNSSINDYSEKIIKTMLDVTRQSNVFIESYSGSGKSLLISKIVAERQKLLEYLSTPRTRDEIAEYLGIDSVSYAIKKYINPLIERGIVSMTIPDKPKSKNQKYVSKH